MLNCLSGNLNKYFMHKLNQSLSFNRDFFLNRKSRHLYVQNHICSCLIQELPDTNAWIQHIINSYSQTATKSDTSTNMALTEKKKLPVCVQTVNEFSNLLVLVFESKLHNETAWEFLNRRLLPVSGFSCWWVVYHWIGSWIYSVIVSLVKWSSLEERAAAACQRWTTAACLCQCFNDVCECVCCI